MVEEWGAGFHSVLIVAKVRQYMGDEIVKRAKRIRPCHRPPKFLKLAKMIGKPLFDERHHRSCRFVRRKPLPRGWNSLCRKLLSVRTVIVPFAACWLIPFH